MRKRLCGFGALGACCLISVTGLATPIPTLDIAVLVAKSDVVVIGTVNILGDLGPTSVELPNGVVPARMVGGSVDVDEVVKGPAGLATLRFQHVVPDTPIGFRTPTPESYRVIFLKRRSDSTNEYELTSPYHPSVVAIPGTRLRSEDATDRVLEAVERVLTSPKASSMLKREAINVFFSNTSAIPRAGLKSALQDSDPSIQLSAAAALLKADDVSGLGVAELSLMRSPQSNFNPVLVNNLRGAIAHGIKSPAAVPALTRLMGAQDAETRRAATRALGRTQSSAALAPLVRALDDSDFEVRLNAVRGLAELAGQKEGIPSWDAFRSDEPWYVSHWKEWAARPIRRTRGAAPDG